MQIINSLKLGAKLFASTAALTLALGSTAYAVDADAVAARLQAYYAKQGGNLSFDSVDSTRSSIFLRGAKAKIAAVSDEAFLIGDITLDDVEDMDDGSVKIGEITVPDLSVDTDINDKPGGKTTIEGVSFENVLLPAENATGALGQMIFYDRATIDKIEIAGPKTDAAIIEGMEATFSRDDASQKVNFSWSIDSIDMTIDPETTGDSENSLADFGMDKISASIESSGQWELASGKATLDKFELDIDDIGKLSITAQIGGYDLAFVEAMQKTQESLTKSGTDSSAASMAALGLAEQLTVKDISIRFDDASLTSKVLDYYAKQQGSDAATLSEQIKMMVPFFAAQIKNIEFAKAVKNATESYFTNPKSLTISASPDQPVSVGAIVATGSTDPTKLIDLLKVGIVANK